MVKNISDVAGLTYHFEKLSENVCSAAAATANSVIASELNLKWRLLPSWILSEVKL